MRGGRSGAEMLVGRHPVEGADLASQATLPQFENEPNRKQLYRMEALADCVIERHRWRLHGRAQRIMIDLDPTRDSQHGRQQLSFFHGHYDPRRNLLVGTDAVRAGADRHLP